MKRLEYSTMIGEHMYDTSKMDDDCQHPMVAYTRDLLDKYHPYVPRLPGLEWKYSNREYSHEYQAWIIRWTAEVTDEQYVWLQLGGTW